MTRRALGGAALAVTAGVVVAGLVPAVQADGADEAGRNGAVYVEADDFTVTLGNGLVERTWSLDRFATTRLVDRRGGGARNWAAGEDFSIDVGGQQVNGSTMDAVSYDVAEVPGGLRVTFTLSLPGGAVGAVRTAEMYNGIAGVRMQTTLTSLAPLAVTGAHLESVGSPDATDLTPTLSAFRAGADWREPGWEGPALSVGDPHAGTWRSSTTAAAGEGVAGPGQYLSLAAPEGTTAFVALERNDFPSSRAEFDGKAGSVLVDYPADVVSLGPLEENSHVEHPLAGAAVSAGRSRVVRPGLPLTFEPAFLGFGRNADDEAWQFHQYLRRQMGSYELDATFNSNGTDSNQISTGAKDDVDFATVQQLAPLARQLGVSTFILDDGWQAISGDWEPDSPAFPEPRGRYAPRFPDASFAAVREAITPMRLGLWMSPTFFNPASSTYKAHPEWVCSPVGHGLAAYNTADGDSSSNEAGLGAWGPDVLPYVQGRIDRAIVEWGVSYFKFDFLAWFDCAGQGDLYDFKQRFVAMLDSLRAAHPGVTFQIDETNDYRLFPFESVTRGPSWFQNGSPTPQRLLHNLWNLSPWIPAFSLGQHFLGDYRGTDVAEVDLRMAVALLSHPTFFSDLRRYDGSVLDRASAWLAFRRANLASFTGVVYPLLADPLDGGWTALQSWDPEEGSGALLAFRQSADAATVSVPLRNVPDGGVFRLTLAPTGEDLGTVTSEQLQSGLEVTIGSPNGQAVILIAPA